MRRVNLVRQYARYRSSIDRTDRRALESTTPCPMARKVRLKERVATRAFDNATSFAQLSIETVAKYGQYESAPLQSSAALLLDQEVGGFDQLVDIG